MNSPEKTEGDRDDYMTPGEASADLGVTPTTLLRMAARGDVVAIVLPSGHRRYLRASIEAIASRKFPSRKTA